MIDPWIVMANQLVPDYDELCKVLEMTPEIFGEITGRTLEVKVRNPVDHYAYNIYGEHDNKFELDACVDWCATELENWPKCRRTAWNQWSFAQREDAEKFLTFLNLKW